MIIANVTIPAGLITPLQDFLTVVFDITAQLERQIDEQQKTIIRLENELDLARSDLAEQARR